MNEDALDRALGSYSGSEPRIGIEARVLNRVRSQRRHALLPWVLVPIVGCLCAAMFWPHRQRPATPVFAVAPAVVEQTIVSPPVVRRTSVRYMTSHYSRSKSAPAPRITLEERALVQYAVRDPEGLRAGLDELDKRSSAPILISELKIEPLDIGSEKKGNQ